MEKSKTFADVILVVSAITALVFEGGPAALC